MSAEELSYSELVRLANDPANSNAQRDAYRERLNALYGERLREAFNMVGRPGSPETDAGTRS